MQLWFYQAKYGNSLDKLIAFWTQGPFSHVELVFSNGDCLSSSVRDGGVRFKQIPLTEKWIVIDLGGDDREAAIRDWATKEVGKKYYYWGTICVALGIPSQHSSGKWYCSELISYIMNSYQFAKMPVNLSPNDIYWHIITQIKK